MQSIMGTIDDTRVERTVPGRLGAAGSRLLSLVVLLGLVVGLFAAIAAPTAAAGQQRGSHAAPTAGQTGKLDCAKPKAVRKGKKVVIPAKTVAKMCQLFGDGQTAGAA